MHRLYSSFNNFTFSMVNRWLLEITCSATAVLLPWSSLVYVLDVQQFLFLQLFMFDRWTGITAVAIHFVNPGLVQFWCWVLRGRCSQKISDLETVLVYQLNVSLLKDVTEFIVVVFIEEYCHERGHECAWLFIINMGL